MNKLTEFVISNSRFTILLLVAVILGGISTYSSQPRQEDPEVTLRVAKVVANFPGLAPERVEQLITKPIEDVIKQMPEIESIDAVSMTGTAIITPEVAPQYTDLDPIWDDLRTKMEDLAPSLPEGTQGPFVNDDFGRVAVATIALTGSDYTMAELLEVAEDVRDEISSLPLVAKVDLYGVQEERIWIEIDPEFMRQLEISPDTLSATIRGQNIVLPGGSITADGQRFVIEPSGDFKSIDELKDLAISTPDGGLVYLQDIAQIRRDYIDPPQSLAFYNGKPAIVFGVSMVAGSNVVAMGEELTANLQHITPRLPVGMALDVAIFQPDLVQASVNSASINLLQTMAVVLVVVMLFLGWRTGLIVGTMVPLTMMATLLGMAVWDIELHRVSIAAIIVALGLLVDNGVVIAEDIRRRYDLGEERLPAVLATAQSLAAPLLTSSLTTVLAFLPLMLISDTTGEFLRSLGQVLSMALLISWLLAITIIPAFCYWFLSATPTIEKLTGDNTRSIQLGSKAHPSYSLYRYLLHYMLNHRLLFVAVMLGLLLVAISAFSLVKQRSLGPSERNQFTVYVDLPAGYAIGETKQSVDALNQFLFSSDDNPEVTDVLAYVGSGGPRFFLALSPNETQPNKAFLVVNTQRADQIDAVMERVQRFIVEQLPQANGRAELLFLGPAPLGTVELRIMGRDINELRRIGDEVESIFYQVDGVQAVRNDWENAVLKSLVDIDQDRARRAGVSSESIAKSLSGYYDGEQITIFRESDKTIPVVSRAQYKVRDTLDRLRTVEVPASDGTLIPLLQVANFDGKIEPSKIIRYNQNRAMTVAAKHPSYTALELYEKIQAHIDDINLPQGYRIELEGEIKGSAKSNAALFQYAPQALFGILFLLVLQFRSFRRSALVLSTIPLILIGAIGGLLLFRAYFDFTGMLGLFSLAGILINNGIVLIDLIDRKRETLNDIHEAIMAAALERARPIVMTTLTTIVGLIPLALFGGEFWYGMAIVIMCGLGVGTVLTLGFVPVMYSLLFSGRKPLVND